VVGVVSDFPVEETMKEQPGASMEGDDFESGGRSDFPVEETMKEQPGASMEGELREGEATSQLRRP
jgi:hypothetical protein